MFNKKEQVLNETKKSLHHLRKMKILMYKVEDEVLDEDGEESYNEGDQSLTPRQECLVLECLQQAIKHMEIIEDYLK